MLADDIRHAHVNPAWVNNEEANEMSFIIYYISHRLYNSLRVRVILTYVYNGVLTTVVAKTDQINLALLLHQLAECT